MQKSKIALLADLHLRDSLYGSAELGQRVKYSVLSAIDKAHEVGCTVVIFAGDIVNTPKPKVRVITELKAILDRVESYGMAWYFVSGNHDRLPVHWSDVISDPMEKSQAHLPYVSGEHHLTPDAIIQIGEMTITGCDYCSRQELMDTWEAMDVKEPVDFFVWHGAIKELYPFGGESGISIDEIPGDKVKNFLVGDLHKHVSLTSKDGRVTAYYPGSTEICSIDEEFEKKFFCFEKENGEIKVTSVGYDSMRILNQKVSTEEDLEKLLASIPKDYPKGVELVYLDVSYDLLKLSNIREAVLTALVVQPTVFKIRPFNPERKEVVITRTKKDGCASLKDIFDSRVPDGDAVKPLVAALLEESVDEDSVIDAWTTERLKAGHAN